MTLHSVSMLAFEFMKKRELRATEHCVSNLFYLWLMQFRQYYITALWTSSRNNAQLLDAARGCVQFGRP
jgi:hypothetical protein